MLIIRVQLQNCNLVFNLYQMCSTTRCQSKYKLITIVPIPIDNSRFLRYLVNSTAIKYDHSNFQRLIIKRWFTLTRWYSYLLTQHIQICIISSRVLFRWFIYFDALGPRHVIRLYTTTLAVDNLYQNMT